MSDEGKTAADQLGEIRKLVQDAQEKLDQVTRALRTLQDRFEQVAAAGPQD
jgi:ABC-type transporter Mla subunit MlaD